MANFGQIPVKGLFFSVIRYLIYLVSYSSSDVHTMQYQCIVLKWFIGSHYPIAWITRDRHD